MNGHSFPLFSCCLARFYSFFMLIGIELLVMETYNHLQAAYVITGNCKNVMNMSQSDQSELWRSILNGMSAWILRESFLSVFPFLY